MFVHNAADTHKGRPYRRPVQWEVCRDRACPCPRIGHCYTSDDTPRLITLIGDLFPIKHLSLALGQTFDPVIDGTPMAWKHWAVIAAWGAFGTLVAVRRFSWTPRG